VIPLSVFTEGAKERGLVRLCFAKSDQTLDAAVAALGRPDAMMREIMDHAVRHGGTAALP